MAKTILVVDDDPDFVELIEAVLTPEGYRVVSCPVAKEAHEKAIKVAPDAIILDLLMPGQNGWQVIEELRADQFTASIRIVVCTAAVTEATRQLSTLRRWQCDVLLKPFELSDLLSILAHDHDVRRQTS